MAHEERTPSPSAPVRFGEILRQHRRAAGLTQEGLAERAGLSEHGIQKLESGATHPLRDTADRLSRALKLPDQEDALFKMAARPKPRRTQPYVPSLPTALGPKSRSNLPISPTSFIAHEGQIESVKERLRDNRLLTLSGPGGCGKKRLAVEIARQLESEFSDGVWLIDLAPLVDDSLVSQVIATAVGIVEQPGSTVIDALSAALHSRHTLLILDNCEHVIDTCAQVVDRLIWSCPGVQLLATSRELLGVAGEATWRVASLSAVDPQGMADRVGELAKEVVASESGRLFADRARLVAPSFAITTQNAPQPGHRDQVAGGARAQRLPPGFRRWGSLGPGLSVPPRRRTHHRLRRRNFGVCARTFITIDLRGAPVRHRPRWPDVVRAQPT